MRKMMSLAVLLPLASGGCVAQTAWNVVTLPVKAASATVDKLTTSQAEADRNYGRKMRKEEERRGREAKAANRDARRRAERHDSRERDADPDDRGDY